MITDARATGDLRRGVFLAAAVLAPIALACVHVGLGLGHGGDLAFFREWYLAFRASPATFYRDGPGINYPILGVLLVCAPARLAELSGGGGALGPDAFRLVLKATLVAGEIALVLSAAALARALGEARPRALALALYALPATWATGAWFGQTDVWGSATLVLAACGAVRYRAGGGARWLALGVAALHAAILLKPLTWFAVPALALAIGVALWERRAGWDAWALVLLSPLLWVVPDVLVVLPDGHRSHLAWVVAQSSVHSRLAVTTGASVWSLVAAGDTPADAVRVLGVSSAIVGWALWLAAEAAIAVILVRRRCDDRALVIAAGLGALAMATLLTGVHERYLVHAVPLLAIGVGLRAPRLAALGAVAASAWGMYVLSTLHYDAFVAGPGVIFTRPQPIALLTIAWGVAVAVELARRPRAEARALAPAG